MRILRLLPPVDLKMAVLVCSLWRRRGEDPSLWKWCRVLVLNRANINDLSIKRLLYVQGIHINSFYNWQDADWQEMFQAMMRLPRLKRIGGLARVDLSSVEPGLFGRMLSRLVFVDLSKTIITNAQKEEFFIAMSKNSRLKEIYFFNLASVEPELFGRVVSRLEGVNLMDSEITKDQVLALFEEMSQNSQLKKMGMADNILSFVDPELFGRVVSRLEHVDLSMTGLDNDQVQELFRAMSLDNQLKSLDLTLVDLSSVEPALFGRMVTRLESVILSYTSLTNSHVLALFSAMSQNCQLKKLTLQTNNLSSVLPAVLATAVTRLEDVNLEKTELTNEQITSILAHVQEDTKLKKLFLGGNNIANIEIDIIRNAKESLGDGLNLELLDQKYGHFFN